MCPLMSSNHISTHLAFLSTHQSKWKAATFHSWARPSWLTRHPRGRKRQEQHTTARASKNYRRCCSEKRTLKTSNSASETPPPHSPLTAHILNTYSNKIRSCWNVSEIEKVRNNYFLHFPPQKKPVVGQFLLPPVYILYFFHIVKASIYSLQ